MNSEQQPRRAPAQPARSSASVHVSACKISDDDIAASFGVTPKETQS